MLDPKDLESFIERRNRVNDTTFMREFQAWVRATLLKPS